MRVLLDECVPRSLKHHLAGHSVQTVGEMGWSAKRNSELLALMVAHGFECLLTVDQNIAFQQDVSAMGVAVVVAVSRTNRLKDLEPLVPGILAALARVAPGQIARVPSGTS